MATFCPMAKKTKPAAELRRRVIRVTATDAQKKQIKAAAKAAGESVSSWLLGLGLAEAMKVGS